MKIGVKILPRQEILDTQGRTVTQTLQQNGRDLIGCRVGKYIVLELEAHEADAAWNQAKEITEFVLYNPLIESYELEFLDES